MRNVHDVSVNTVKTLFQLCDFISNMLIIKIINDLTNVNYRRAR